MGGNRKGTRARRITILSCINNNNNYTSPFHLEGYTDRDVFIIYLKKALLPELKRIRKMKLRNGELKIRRDRLTVIMDNASFHKSDEISELFEKNRVNLIYLPPYSPDLNPIEHKWAQLKAKFRKYTNMWMFNGLDRVKDKIKLIDRLLMLGSEKLAMV